MGWVERFVSRLAATIKPIENATIISIDIFDLLVAADGATITDYTDNVKVLSIICIE